jgi:hypothetical protein
LKGLEDVGVEVSAALLEVVSTRGLTEAEADRKQK